MRRGIGERLSREYAGHSAARILCLDLEPFRTRHPRELKRTEGVVSLSLLAALGPEYTIDLNEEGHRLLEFGRARLWVV